MHNFHTLQQLLHFSAPLSYLYSLSYLSLIHIYYFEIVPADPSAPMVSGWAKYFQAGYKGVIDLAEKKGDM